MNRIWDILISYVDTGGNRFGPFPLQLLICHICYTVGLDFTVANFTLTFPYTFALCFPKEGRYEYKYIVDGKWVCNDNEKKTKANADGHVNNYVQVSRDGTSDEERELRERLTGQNPDLTKEERLMIREYLEQYVER